MKEWLCVDDYISPSMVKATSIYFVGVSWRRSWIRPEEGYIKCNYDDPFVDNTLSKSVWIIQDERGTYLGSGQCLGSFTMNSFESDI